MKKLAYIFIGLFFGLGVTVFAATNVSWTKDRLLQYPNYIGDSVVIGNTATTTNTRLEVNGTSTSLVVVATSTTASSSLPRLTTTGVSATFLCLTGDTCRTTWPSGGSSMWATSTADATAIHTAGASKVGIGTTSPYAKLSVAGTIVTENIIATSTTASSTFFNLYALSASTTNLAVSGAFFQGGLTDCSSANQFTTYTLASGKFGCGTPSGSGTTTFPWQYIHSKGLVRLSTTTNQVLIGNTATTTATEATLTIDGNTNRRQLVVQSHSSQSTSTAQFQTSTGRPFMSIGNSSLTQYSSLGLIDIDDSGLIPGGLGTNNSDYGAALTVSVDDDLPYLMKFYNKGFSPDKKDAVLAYFAENSGKFRFLAPSTTPIAFNINGFTADTEVLTMLPGGNVGIGTSSPYAKLSVAGTIVAQNFIATSTTASSTFFNLFAQNASTTNFAVSGGFFQNTFTDCTGAANKVTYTLASGKFGCATDQTGGGTALKTYSYIVDADGAGDFTTIQGALDACGLAGGGSIYLTDHYYYIGGTGLLFKGNDCNVYGVYASTTIEVAGATTAFKTNSAASAYANNGVHNVVIVGDGNTSSIGIDMSDMIRSRYTGIVMDNLGRGFRLNDTQNVTFYNTVRDFAITTIQVAGIDASSTNPTNDNKFSDGFIGCAVSGCIGINLNNAQNNLFSGISIEPATITGTIGVKIDVDARAANSGTFANQFYGLYAEANKIGIAASSSISATKEIHSNGFYGGQIVANTTNTLDSSGGESISFFGVNINYEQVNQMATTTFTSLVSMGRTAVSTKLTIPYSASPSVATNGDIGIDSTSNQFKYQSGSATRVLGNGNFYPSFTISTTTAWTGSTTIPLGTAFIAETWNSIQCFTNTGTLNVVLNDGTNNMNLFNASTTVGTVALSSNNTFTASEKRYATIGTPASSPTIISCSVSKSYTAD